MPSTIVRRLTGVMVVGVILIAIGGNAALATGLSDRPGPPADDAAIDAYLHQAVADLGIPGLAFAIVRGDAAPHILVVGTADDSGRPITPATPFLLASVSKAFAATSIMQLVEQGRVDLDAPVQRYLPWFTAADRESSAKITVRDLLEQSSGFTTAEGTAPIPGDDQSDGAIERLVRSLADDELAFAPGEGYEYSNANYDTVAEIVQTVAGVTYDRYLADHVYGPLGLRHSFATATSARADGLASGSYPWFGSVWRSTPMPLPRSMPGSSTTFSSIGDMARWVQVNLNGGELDGTRILSADGMATLHRGANPIDDFHAYGMGWQVRPLWEAVRLLPDDAVPNVNQTPTDVTDPVTLPLLIEHGGSWANAHTYVGLAPSAGWGFALLVDAGDEATHRLDTLESNVLRLLAGQAATPPADVSDPLVAGRFVLVIGLLALEIASLVWSIRAIRRRRRSIAVARMLDGDGPRSARRTLIVFALAIALDLLVVWLYLVFLPDHFDSGLAVILSGQPDAALCILPTLVIAIVWGPIRTIWLGWLLLQRPRRLTAQPT